jgi:ribosome-binding protein aMBF1 (putative translation factor)
MQHIKNYFKKIEAVLDRRKASPKKKSSKAKGLLAAPPSVAKTEKEDATLKMVADYIEGIRETRQEILDGNK